MREYQKAHYFDLNAFYINVRTPYSLKLIGELDVCTKYHVVLKIENLKTISQAKLKADTYIMCFLAEFYADC